MVRSGKHKLKFMPKKVKKYIKLTVMLQQDWIKHCETCRLGIKWYAIAWYYYTKKIVMEGKTLECIKTCIDQFKDQTCCNVKINNKNKNKDNSNDDDDEIGDYINNQMENLDIDLSGVEITDDDDDSDNNDDEKGDEKDDEVELNLVKREDVKYIYSRKPIIKPQKQRQRHFDNTNKANITKRYHKYIIFIRKLYLYVYVCTNLILI